MLHAGTQCSRALKCIGLTQAVICFSIMTKHQMRKLLGFCIFSSPLCFVLFLFLSLLDLYKVSIRKLRPTVIGFYTVVVTRPFMHESGKVK